MLRDIIAGFVSLFQPENIKDDRREVIRLRCRFEVFCLSEKEVVPATVTDMGLQGLRLNCAAYFKPGTAVSLLYRGAVGERLTLNQETVERDIDGYFSKGVQCKISWSKKEKYSKGSMLGVTYNDSSKRMSKSWVKKILKEIGFDQDSIFQRRKILRVISSIPCKLTTDRETWRGRAINMGAGGALFQGDHEIGLGKTLTVHIGPYKKLKNLQLRGEIMTERYEQLSNGWLQGIRFTSLTSDQTDLLGKYVVSLLKEQVKS